MEKVLEQALVDIITKATNAAESAGQFLVEQTPDVVQQVLWWNFTYNIIWWCIGVLLLLGAYPFWKMYVIKARTLYKIAGDCELTATFSIVIGICLGVLHATISLINLCNLTWLKIWIAPKLYLIEYAAKLIK